MRCYQWVLGFLEMRCYQWVLGFLEMRCYQWVLGFLVEVLPVGARVPS